MWTPAALEEDWRTFLDSIASSEGLISSRDANELGRAVRTLSDAYNDEAPVFVHAASDEETAARLHFSFVRDVAKGASAVRELVFSAELRERESIDILDLGAGLGAMSVGVTRALRATGYKNPLRIHLVDQDARALRMAEKVVKRDGEVAVRVTQKSLPTVPSESYDLILLGQVLSELDRSEAPAARVEKHAGLLARLVQALRPGGFLVVVEPALRTRTRHLHALRELLLGRAAASVYAPCLHEAACPLFAKENDWCHEDLPIDLPAWLVPAARAAGLRYEGLTFSYLVLRRKGERSLVDRFPNARRMLRLVSTERRTKGKLEREVCLARDLDGSHGLRARLLDRDLESGHLPFVSSPRGAILESSEVLEKERVGAAVAFVDLTL